MSKEEIIERLEEIAKHAVHVLGEEPFFMSLDDRIAIHEAIDILKSAQPETANIIVGKSRDGMTMWYQCDNCNEPVDENDLYCRVCGRRFEHGSD